MRSFFNILLFVIFANQVFSQNDKEFKKNVISLNQYLNLYIDIKQNDDDVNLKTLKLNKQEKEILYKLVDKNSESIPAFDLKSIYQELFIEKLKLVLNDKTVLKYQLDSLIKGMEIVVSPDKKLYNLKVYENTGGTYQSYLSFIHFRTDSGKIINIFNEESNTNSAISSDGYYKIDTIQTDEGVKYILLGFVKGCTTCANYNLTLLNPESDNLLIDFYLSIDQRGWDEAISYDKENRIITVAYSADDLNKGCNCNESSDSEEFVEHFCKFTYQFDGSTFKLKKQEISF